MSDLMNDNQQKGNAFFRFLSRKDIVISAKRYGIDALGAMALGLFGSLLIGTIFNAIGLIPFLKFFATIGAYGTKAAGPAMAVAIAFALKAPPLVMYSAALVGFAANDLGKAGDHLLGALCVFRSGSICGGGVCVLLILFVVFFLFLA